MSKLKISMDYGESVTWLFDVSCIPLESWLTARAVCYVKGLKHYSTLDYFLPIFTPRRSYSAVNNVNNTKKKEPVRLFISAFFRTAPFIKPGTFIKQVRVHFCCSILNLMFFKEHCTCFICLSVKLGNIFSYFDFPKVCLG